MHHTAANYRFNPTISMDKQPALPDALMHLDSKACETLTASLGDRLNKQQSLLHASATRGVLVVLQGMDTAGKDGVIRHVFRHVSPLGVRAEAFGAPTPQELSHDFLWRVHAKTPARGEMVIFNRSHYEDVLVTRVRGLITPSQWKARYDHIRNFEQLLHDEGVSILKFMLHISKSEQKKRLQARLDDPHKRWKLQASDFQDREHWDDFQRAYQDAIHHTDAPHAPWYIIPADSKPHRDLIIAQILTETLEAMTLEPPPGHLDPTSIHLR
jgi:PPK2 family polyphosphate:nucleotide phosphotransferase